MGLNRKFILFAIGFVFFASSIASAKIFRNSYVSFRLPDNWNCSAEGTEWVCRSSNIANIKQAAIILTAKEAGPSDNLQNYSAYLKQPKAQPDPHGHSVPSKVIDVVQRTINNQPWVDGMHLGSELYDYYTRYLATVRNRIAILVTFSAEKSYYTQYSTDFFNAVLSLRVVNEPNSSSGNGAGGIGPASGELLGPGAQLHFPPDMTTASGGPALPAQHSKRGVLIGIILGILALATYIYLVMKRRRKKTKSKRPGNSGGASGGKASGAGR